jgi:hypothetical protein
MGIQDIFQVKKLSAELARVTKERDQLKAALSDIERMEAYGLRKAIIVLTARKKKAQQEVEAAENAVSERKRHLLADAESAVADRRRILGEQIASAEAAFLDRQRAINLQLRTLNEQVAFKQQEIVILDEEILLQSFGFYKPRYDLTSSNLYKARLEQIRSRQAAMVKSHTAVRNITAWTVNNSKREGERLIKDHVKLILRSFNNECDVSIMNVKFSNINSIEKKIRAAFDALNRLGAQMTIAITNEYLNLKLEELYLCYEYQVKKQEEKEEQRRIREQIREEAKLLKEIEAAKEKLRKEASHFNKALESINARIQTSTTDSERQLLATERGKITQKLGEVAENMLTVEKREQNTRAGYVYVISNIGSFGENIYKIGVTRRLEPQERIDELGSASVPFNFDVHAFIFSDDAPALETALHRAFEHRRLNMINRRREFFNVTLDEIERVIRTSFSKPVEFVRLADAAQYRQSLKLRNGTEENSTDLIDRQRQNYAIKPSLIGH